MESTLGSQWMACVTNTLVCLHKPTQQRINDNAADADDDNHNENEDYNDDYDDSDNEQWRSKSMLMMTTTISDSVKLKWGKLINVIRYPIIKGWGTGIRGLMRGMATLPQGNQELLVVRDKAGRPPGELGVSKSMECDIFPSVLWHCWLGNRKGIRPVKKPGWWFVGGDDLTGALHDL